MAATVPTASPFGGGGGDFGGAFTFGTYLWNFQASQVLWSYGIRPALRGVEVGRARVEADLEEVQNRVARDTVTRLYSYLLGLRTRDVLQQAVETSERGLDLARDRLELGAGARLDVLRARVQLSRLRRQLADAEDALMVERAGINALVGREQAKAIEVLDDLELPDPLPRILPAEALMELAGQQRPTVRQFGLDRELLEAQTSLALADARPEVRATASYGINTFTLENTYDLQLHNWNAGVSLTWNLFDGFGSGSRVASLRSQVTQNDWEQNEYESTLEGDAPERHRQLAGGADRDRGGHARPRRGHGGGTGRRGRTHRRRRDGLPGHGRPCRPAATSSSKRPVTPMTP